MAEGKEVKVSLADSTFQGSQGYVETLSQNNSNKKKRNPQLKCPSHKDSGHMALIKPFSESPASHKYSHVVASLPLPRNSLRADSKPHSS